MKDVLISWSGGKDSCMALYEIQRSREYCAVALLTTITSDYDRVSMHGVRRVLLASQADSLGLPLHQVLISKDATNSEYESKLLGAVNEYRSLGVDSIVFGDLFLEDIKNYRDQFLSQQDLQGIYPVWLRDTSEFIREFIGLGFKAITTCVNSEVLDQSFVGMPIDESFLSSLPANVDPCGENGEFHTFVYDGPNFKAPITFSIGEKVQRGPFSFCDLVPEC